MAYWCADVQHPNCDLWKIFMDMIKGKWEFLKGDFFKKIKSNVTNIIAKNRNLNTGTDT